MSVYIIGECNRASVCVRERVREMGSISTEKPHAVCVPYPAQGHVTPMLKVAKLLHSHGFHNTEFNHNRLIHSRGPSAVEGPPGFNFETIPDGLPPSDLGATQDIPSLCRAIATTFISSFRDLINRLNTSGGPPITCIVGDGVMSFTLDAAEEFGLPGVSLLTMSAIGFMAYFHYPQLIERGLVPLNDTANLTNGYLETPVDWIPGLKHMRLRDLPSFIRTTDPDDIMLNFACNEAQRARRATAILINTFDDLDRTTLESMAPLLPPVFTVGPLSLLLPRHVPADNPLTPLRSSLWREEASALDWLEGRAPRSVVYVNYGSITVMSNEQLVEFAWGLANSGHDFLWVTRPDLVKGDSAALPREFMAEVDKRGLLVSWCPQEEVLAHLAVGVFLTHSGWNSTLESICGGVPMLCWPCFSEQQTNCRYAIAEWGNGMEIDSDVKREVVEGMIREVMGGEKGKEILKKALEWKESAVRATEPGGSSFMNFEKVVEKVLRPKK